MHFFDTARCTPFVVEATAAHRPARRRGASRARGGVAAYHSEPLESRALLAAGTLDPSFGNGGVARLSFPGFSATAEAAAVQNDGKTVVVGWSADKRFAVARFNVDGTPDQTFGPDYSGTVLTAFGHDTFARAVAIQNDGRIVVVGGADDGVDVARYTPGGLLDPTFDGDGRTNFDYGFYAQRAVANAVELLRPQSLDAPERILIGGTVFAGGPLTAPDDDFFFTRLSGVDGSVDDSFGDEDGLAIFGLGEEDQLSAMAVDYSGTPTTNPHYGKIVAAGTTVEEFSRFQRMAILRVGPDGALDRAFDGDSSASATYDPSVSTSGRALVIQADGKYVVAGNAGDNFVMTRFLPGDGAVDLSFGPAGTGWARADLGGIDQATDLARGYDGALLLGGTSTTGDLGTPGVQRNAFAAFTPDGRVDTRFGTNGEWTVNFNGGRRFATGPGRRFVFVGGGAMQAARFLDVGANLVRAASLDPVAPESGADPATFFVYRSERLPYATRVYYTAGGTATRPLTIIGTSINADYTGMARAADGSTVAYAEIPANETFTVVTITPRQDTRVEGNETAVFTLIPNPEYELGAPSAVTITIVDDDAPPPGVAQVYIGGTGWRGPNADPADVSFKEYLQARGLGDSTYGFRADNLPANTTLPWINLNQIVLRYSSPPTGAGVPFPGGITLDGVRSDYAVTAVTQLDPQTFALTLDRALGNLPGGAGSDGDRVTLRVAGGAGGGAAYTLVLNPIQGDADHAGGRVNAFDMAYVKARLNRTSSETAAAGTAYSPFADVTGDGRINAVDLASVKPRLNDFLPPAASGTLSDTARMTKDILGRE